MGYTVYALFDERQPDAIRYVGLSKDVEARFRAHLRQSRTRKRSHKTNWMRSVAAEGSSVGWRVLGGEYGSIEEAADAEIRFISECLEQGCRLVNETSGGEGAHLTPEARERWRAIMTSPEYRAKASAALKGKPKTAEHAAKVGAAHKGRPKSAEQRAKISATKTGNVVIPEEMRARISEKLKGLPKSPETRSRMREAQRKRFEFEAANNIKRTRDGRPCSPETRAKLSAVLKGRIISADARAKNSAKHTGMKRSEETRARMREAQRLRFAKKADAQSFT